MKAFIISLGCPKNLTDSEVLMGKLAELGYEITTIQKEADLIVVNTCAFLKSARKESIETINEAIKNKRRGAKVVVAGCLLEYDKKGNREVYSQVSGELKADGTIKTTGLFESYLPRIKATPPWTAYVKISEGCDNNCSYCTIPSIRGLRKNRESFDIIQEVDGLAKRGVKEIILIAQDTAAYPDLPELLKKIVIIEGIKWIRVMYAHPAHVSAQLIDVIKNESKIVKYLDLPLQHICDNILKNMHRRITRAEIVALIDKLRREIPNLVLRTSFIVGFPGETESDFEELVDFVKKVKFERLGVFKYSQEEGTPAYNMRGQVPEKVKDSRFHKLMALQKKISLELNKKLIGNSFDVLLESVVGGCYIGRTYMDSPEIDCSVKVNGSGFKVGEIIRAKVTNASPYDLVASKTT
ncbi:30S ribosomal protein S12 methylthiotransferase RimO [Candidatus Saganbacteria bacterium]|nr:30S ribosomal protein S12 methylthiotransferase RimO [Candidatus Saganbacteria bacterium]